VPAAAQGLGDLGHVGGRGVPETAPGEPGEVEKNGGKMVEKWENGGKMMDKCG